MDIGLIIKIILVSVAFLAGIGSMFIGKYKDTQDNPIEEKAEQIIKEETGVDIDLSPSSKENKE